MPAVAATPPATHPACMPPRWMAKSMSISDKPLPPTHPPTQSCARWCTRWALARSFLPALLSPCYAPHAHLSGPPLVRLSCPAVVTAFHTHGHAEAPSLHKCRDQIGLLCPFPACRLSGVGLRGAREQRDGHPLRFQGLHRPAAQAGAAHAAVRPRSWAFLCVALCWFVKVSAAVRSAHGAGAAASCGWARGLGTRLGALPHGCHVPPCRMVEEIHLEGGTVLGTSRALPVVSEIVKRLGEWRGPLGSRAGQGLGAGCALLAAAGAGALHAAPPRTRRASRRADHVCHPPLPHSQPCPQIFGRSTSCSSWAGAAATPPPRPSPASATPNTCRAAWSRCPRASTTTCCW